MYSLDSACAVVIKHHAKFFNACESHIDTKLLIFKKYVCGWMGMCTLVLGVVDIMAGIQIPGVSYELPAMGAGQPNSGPQQVQPVLMTAEPPL